jgi:hypothetical protein
MSQNFIFNASFHLLLITIDQELANGILEQGCPYCKGKLHRADYPRSPIGMLLQFRDYYNERLSLCCAICRKRITPPSVRFFGRRWYPAPLHLLMSALMLGINERRLLLVKRHFGVIVSESTWKRWRKWWRESFTSTSFWQQAKGLAQTAIESESHKTFPRALLEAFQGGLEEKMYFILRFLSPLTGGVLRAV